MPTISETATVLEENSLPDYSLLGCPSCGSYYMCNWRVRPAPEGMSFDEAKDYEENAPLELHCGVCGVVEE